MRLRIIHYNFWSTPELLKSETQTEMIIQIIQTFKMPLPGFPTPQSQIADSDWHLRAGKKKIFGRFSAFYGQRSVAEARTNPSPWSNAS